MPRIPLYGASPRRPWKSNEPGLLGCHHGQGISLLLLLWIGIALAILFTSAQTEQGTL